MKTPIKIVRFSGGLGNQMFQYAFYKSLQKFFPNVKADLSRYESCSPHNGFELESIFNIKLSRSSGIENAVFRGSYSMLIGRVWKRLCKISGKYVQEEKLFSFDPNVFANQKSAYYNGYWQNENYFKNIYEILMKDFTLTPPKDDLNIKAQKQIENSHSVSLHIRRGDYINNSLFDGVCTIEYYRNAIKYMRERLSDISWFVFSNDISWCRENIQLDDCTYLDWNTGKKNYIDMYLMSLCKHNIIANSTFSWWGAWLNKNPKKIILTPEIWFNGVENLISPSEWVRIPIS